MCTTGLVAAYRVPAGVVGRMREAFLAGQELQRRRPEFGLVGFRRFSDVSEEHVRASWALYAPSAFDGGAPGTMNADRWRDTIAHVTKARGLSRLPGELVYRSEPLAGAVERIAA